MSSWVGRNPSNYLLSIGLIVVLGSWIVSSPQSISARQEGEEAGELNAGIELSGENRILGPQDPIAESHSGLRIRIAIDEIEDRTGATAVTMSEAGNVDIDRVPVATIKDRLVAAIARSHRFDIVEVLSEGIGGFSGAEYLITGSVRNWKIDPTGTVDEVDSIRVGRLAVARVGISFRIADGKTGQVLFATAEQTDIGLWQADGSEEAAAGLSSEEMSAAALSAIDICVHRSVDRLASWFRERPWTASVSAVEDNRVYIDAGSRQGLKAGMILRALSKNQRLIDPETGLVLGSVTKSTGRLEMVEIRDQFSIAEVIEGCDEIRPGDRVERASAAAHLEAEIDAARPPPLEIIEWLGPVPEP